MPGRKPETVAWTSRKASAKGVAKALAKETTRMEKRGYVLVTSDVVQAGRSKRSWIGLGILNFMRGKQVQAIATFRFEPPPTPKP